MSQPQPLNWNSRHLTRGWQQGVNAFFWGMGFQEPDFEKAQVGIGVPLLEGNLCNVHAYQLAKHIQNGCQQAGLIAFPFGVPAVSDNLVQGGEHGGASLVPRSSLAIKLPMQLTWSAMPIAMMHWLDCIISTRMGLALRWL